ncbi:unnamed protein product [Porites evermanni]|uniref:DNA-directed DNA polymerase n=1 Tax=Porites evermanni TaxID=104178 RepID=A0ABN8SUU4_9CNID|nr:unnamed protein product [Porites evermanni]
MAEEYHFSDDEEGDALLDRAYDRWEQLGGAAARGPLFQFTMQPIGRRRRWRDVVERAQFNAQLRQLRDPVPGDNIGMALTEALHQAIETELGREQRPAHHFVNFAITAHGFTHAYQTANFTVGEFLQRTARLDEMLATLAGKLNSNEAFNPDRGFQVDVVFVSMPGRGSGRHKQRNVGRLCLDRDNKKKKCIIPIRNRDALCCARAIVTMRAHCHKDQGVDGFRDWDNLKRGRPVQLRQAQALHQQAGVAEGPCGLPELRQFQQALGSHYQLLVMTRMKPFFLIFKGPDAPHQIRLLKSNDHFDGCTSFPAFVNRSYYCLDCDRGFNTNDRTNHTCQGRRCSACGRFDCQDYVRGTRPTEYCPLCHRKFYGDHCIRHHVVSKQCQSIKTCLKCRAQYTVVPNKRHQCGYAKCPVCQEWVSIQDHKCYIQPVVEQENEEPEPTEEGGGSMVAPPPPLFVYADFEAMQNAEGVFVANLLCYSSSEETTIHVLDGEDCALQFLRDLDDLTDLPDTEGERNILVVFHNLKSFDGMFILHELYQQQREVVDQLTVGAKVLSFRSGAVKFIDSLCFLPMPLASFPSTFNLTELKKGFFPHLFNTPDHQQYVGRIPDLEFYDPEGMMAKKKDELTRWHADQVRRNVTFHFQQEMIEYCKSDVALLKAGCEAFQQQFERQAGFNPMAKCITIASACNLYWRKHHLTPDTIAVEPLGGWRGAQVNQSLKALQRLYYQEHLLPKEGACADRIRHVRNGGEQSVRTIANSYFVDGYDPLTRTVYEFHGCLYHGCPRCYPNRSVKRCQTEAFWGKFGERINKPTTVTVQDPAHLFRLISDAALDLSTLRLCTDDILEAVYTSVQDNAVKGTKTNIFVAAFTTCHARLKLYESLDTLQQQVLYYDTDSVIYRWRPGQPSITTGDFLGDMTDELDGDVITEFVSGGAKNYGYTTRAGKVVCKVRGFTLNVRGSAILNFHTMKDNILSELDSPQDSRRNLNIVTPYYFKRDLEKKQIQVVPRVKQYGLVFDKRVIDVTSRSSFPYGYERIGDELDLLLDL